MSTSHDSFLTPPESIFYEDTHVYVALAHHSMAEGHTVVVWKNPIEDISDLSSNDYEYLMDVIDVARDSLRELLGVEKVYLLYFDEAKHVHWHLVPRYEIKGFEAFQHDLVVLTTFPKAEELSRVFAKNHARMILEN